MIEIGEVLKDFPLFTLDIVSFDLLIGTRLREKDYIKEIKGYDNRLLIHASRVYRSSSMKYQVSLLHLLILETGIQVSA